MTMKNTMNTIKTWKKTSFSNEYTRGLNADVPSLIKFFDEAAIYFKNRPTEGEDGAYWANVYNSENCTIAANTLTSLVGGNYEVFVFGSNLKGVHGKGAALYAKKYFSAKPGVGIGRTGNSYAIPTKDDNIKTLPLDKIQPYIKDFLLYAIGHPKTKFGLTRVGSGLAGYNWETQIKPMFGILPANVIELKEP